MKIGVFVKLVPAEFGMNPGHNQTFSWESAAKMINPPDLSALEEALRIKDETGAQVTVCSMGPASVESNLRQALAMGADRLCLISDPALAGSDTHVTARVLSEAARYLGGFDLILCGRRSIDGETGQVGPELAAFLNMPCMANCVRLQVKQDQIFCRQMLEMEFRDWRTAFPALVTICPGINSPRLPSILGLRQASRMKIEQLTAAALGFSAQEVGLNGSLAEILRLTEKPFGKRAAIYKQGLEGIEPALKMIQEARRSG